MSAISPAGEKRNVKASTMWLVKSPVNWALEPRKQGPRISSQTIHAFTWDASLAEVSIKCNSLYEQIFLSDSLWKPSIVREQKCLNGLFMKYSNTYFPFIFIYQSLEQNSPCILNQFPKNNIYYLINIDHSSQLQYKLQQLPPDCYLRYCSTDWIWSK